MNGRLPLPALLSHTLVAFTIEFDNEFERRVPHRTTNHGSVPGAPWLVSRVMWSRFLQFLPEEGISVADLQQRLGIGSKDLQIWLTRLGKWWGYITVKPDAAASTKRFRPTAIVRLTPGGLRAIAVWRHLDGTIETRWHERFGQDSVERLRELLRTLTGRMDRSLPDSLPILGYGLFSREPDRSLQPAPDGHETRHGTMHEPSLPVVLSKALQAFAIEFEHESEVSLAVASNALRLFGELPEGKAGLRARDLPGLAGVSKEASTMSLSFLKKHGYLTDKPQSPGSRTKHLALTSKGQRGHEACHQRIRLIEASWQERFGSDLLLPLCDALEHLVGEPVRQHSLLFRSLESFPGGWRASLPPSEALPHFPAVLHRGGFPDGS
ncbi:hypothetical protein [Paracidobacterium acidisoli]|uniref:MarR family transcriptional regulator n=1 Tax=Paracidobacterium acidisoli TaxID=2303751 RepID=A0A372IP88_9BACT|nr:hypothetical protein [Paracidobacterium acidisoli]MBT9331062.1 hypothetical protein [Paracidobacterium acidisoli]